MSCLDLDHPSRAIDGLSIGLYSKNLTNRPEIKHPMRHKRESLKWQMKSLN